MFMYMYDRYVEVKYRRQNYAAIISTFLKSTMTTWSCYFNVSVFTKLSSKIFQFCVVILTFSQIPKLCSRPPSGYAGSGTRRSSSGSSRHCHVWRNNDLQCDQDTETVIGRGHWDQRFQTVLITYRL